VIRDLETVVANGLCSGCGLCESVAGRERVRMTMTAIGQLRPAVAGPLPEPVLAEALAVCPGVEVRGPVPEPGVSVHPVWGPIASLARGWSTDAEVRHHSSAGGVLSALALHLLERDGVDAVLHVRAALPDRPLETVAHISRTRADVLDGAQSRYGPAAPLVHVHRLLDEGRRFAVVAKPCDISAVRALQRRDPRARARIGPLLTSYCGGVPSLLMAEKIVRSHGVEPDEVAEFRFRGDGWPGPIRTTVRDGRTFDVTYDTAWYDPTVPWTYDMQFRCKICPDAIGEVADLSCPDGWVLRDGEPIHLEDEGRNIIIARTRAGQALVERARSAGYLETAPCTTAELEATERDHLPRKLSAHARATGVRLAGRPSLRIRGYRGGAALRRSGVRHTVLAAWGGFRRARRGANREPQP
jgi:coenzyme F420 hydrogenase subunit beta